MLAGITRGTANALNQMPKSLRARAKGHLQDIWMAETKADAEDAFDFFVRAYRAKYDKAVECLTKDRDRLLTFHDFPAEHWKHLRSTNPIESTLAPVRPRTAPQGPRVACREKRRSPWCSSRC